MTTVHPQDLFNFATLIEEDGEKFYRGQAEKLSDAKIKELFTQLAEEEVAHKKLFTEMFSDVERFTPFESYPGEYQDYLASYADTLVFQRDSVSQEAEKITDVKEALNFAIRREIDTISYYQEIKNLVQENDVKKVDDVISEERKHVVRLSNLKKELLG